MFFLFRMGEGLRDWGHLCFGRVGEGLRDGGQDHVCCSLR